LKLVDKFGKEKGREYVCPRCKTPTTSTIYPEQEGAFCSANCFWRHTEEAGR